jgi:hypothetical protein
MRTFDTRWEVTPVSDDLTRPRVVAEARVTWGSERDDAVLADLVVLHGRH